MPPDALEHLLADLPRRRLQAGVAVGEGFIDDEWVHKTGHVEFYRARFIRREIKLAVREVAGFKVAESFRFFRHSQEMIFEPERLSAGWFAERRTPWSDFFAWPDGKD